MRQPLPDGGELLSLTGLPFTVMAGNGEEIISTEDPARAVSELSRQKAEAVLLRAEDGDTVIGGRYGGGPGGKDPGKAGG